MAIKYSDEDKNALMQKAKNPESDVVCPRCGAPLQYREVNASYEVKCKTTDCLKMTVRGL